MLLLLNHPCRGRVFYIVYYFTLVGVSFVHNFCFLSLFIFSFAHHDKDIGYHKSKTFIAYDQIETPLTFNKGNDIVYLIFKSVFLSVLYLHFKIYYLSPLIPYDDGG